ncbi:caspase domain-containing protein [Mycena leptocephala]|nr:caspase domain-containing protein [Mycena leptocephala]
MDAETTPPNTPPAVLRMSNIDPSTVFALIIGIDDYIAPGIRNLGGCVNDAEAFKKFLLDHREGHGLGVPSTNLLFLKNAEATRSRIIEAFKTHFTHNDRIPENGEATMILFFAGHGGRVSAPGNLMASDEQVETICPHDERTYGPSGDYVHGIPDYILGWLLHELSQTKGRNITVILDSCHSGGLARESDDDEATSRTPGPSEQPIPLDLDHDLWEKNQQVYTQWYETSPSVILQSAPSHVLLAACREDETAKECQILYHADVKPQTRGRFTVELINSLRCTDPPLNDTTYDELLKRLPKLKEQNPHCGGRNSDQLVFTRRHPAAGVRPMLLTIENVLDRPDPVISISMGSVRGVVKGTFFSVYTPGSSIITGTLVATSVLIHDSILSFPADSAPFRIPNGSRAQVAAWNNEKMMLRVFVPPGFVHTSVIFPVVEVTNETPLHKYVQVLSTKGADLVLRCVNTLTNEIEIERSSMENKYSNRVVLYQQPNILIDVVNGIAHFNYWLRLQPEIGNVLPCGVEMYRLAGQFPGFNPDFKVGNLVKSVSGHQEVNFVSDPDAMYGFIITNDSEVDLYAYLWYFDPDDCTFQTWYHPVGANSAPPLRGKNRLSVGLGSSHPFQFQLPPNLSRSVGFLKIIVSTDYLELRDIEQTISPFEKGFGSERGAFRVTETFKYWESRCVQVTMTDA